MALTKTPIELSSTPGIVDNSNATAITIDSSENVLVGKTATTYATEGAMFEKGSALELTTDSGRVLRVHRTTNDGNIIEFSKDSATVGSIGTKSSLLTIGTGTTGLIFDGGQIYPWNTNTNAAIDASKDLGASGARFKDLYLSGGAYLGGTAAANKLEDYEEGTATLTLASSGTSPTISQGNTFLIAYTKIGNLVRFVGYTGARNVTNIGTGVAKITGLPFAQNGSYYGQVTFAHSTLFDGDVVTGYIESGNTFFFPMLIDSTNSPSYRSGTRYSMIQGFYHTA